jgi:hypothetical protein|tara:strand:- start:3589 stop:3828 length:240 start_codon:yes stop_codon:yes gene_type:complete
MKFYYLEDINKEHIQFFKTKKSALDWIKTQNAIDDWESRMYTKEDIQVLFVPHFTKSSLLTAFNDISLIVGNSINTHEH